MDPPQSERGPNACIRKTQWDPGWLLRQRAGAKWGKHQEETVLPEGTRALSGTMSCALLPHGSTSYDSSHKGDMGRRDKMGRKQ